jgi:hypothetical protein
MRCAINSTIFLTLAGVLSQSSGGIGSTMLGRFLFHESYITRFLLLFLQITFFPKIPIAPLGVVRRRRTP